MTPTPEQVAEWTAKFEDWFATQLTVAGIPRHIQQAYALHGYLHAKTEQATEIEAQPAAAQKLNTTAINLIAASEEREGDDGERCYLVPAQEFDDLQGLLNEMNLLDFDYAQNIEVAITKILKETK